MTISVIIPAYNAESWLPGAVQSIRRQTFSSGEIIIVDDGSTDATFDVAKTLEQTVRRQRNGGLAAARNAGATMARGEWLLFLDADDRLLPHALDSLLTSAEQSRCGLAYGFVLYRGETPEQARLHGLPFAAGQPPKPVQANFWWTAITTPGAALVRRSLHEDVGGFDEPMRHLEDCEYWLRCGMLTGFAHCGTVVLDKTWRPGSLGASLGRNAWFRIKAQRRFLHWCKTRGLDTSFLCLRRGALTDHAIRRILHLREWSFLEPVLLEAKRDRAFSTCYFRAKATLLALKLVGRIPRSFSPPAISDEIT